MQLLLKRMILLFVPSFSRSFDQCLSIVYHGILEQQILQWACVTGLLLGLSKNQVDGSLSLPYITVGPHYHIGFMKTTMNIKK